MRDKSSSGPSWQDSSVHSLHSDTDSFQCRPPEALVHTLSRGSPPPGLAVSTSASTQSPVFVWSVDVPGTGVISDTSGSRA
ncbi:hypothetical protein J6590_011523 [Homalodisca vitripennis]|nr:hypothetical protein J6590_011523 [Homalodisca vitripennis]